MENVRRTTSRRSSRSRSGPNSPPLHRLLSSHHPDDHSVYHHEDGDGIHVRDDTSSLHKTETQRRDPSSSSDDDSSVASTKEKDEAAHDEETTYEEIRGGIPYEHDVEAAKPELEKKKSNRSIKDPNLVSVLQVLRFGTALMFVGDMGFSRRYCESQELVHETQMGCYAYCIVLHARVAHFVVHDLTRPVVN